MNGYMPNGYPSAMMHEYQQHAASYGSAVAANGSLYGRYDMSGSMNMPMYMNGHSSSYPSMTQMITPNYSSMGSSASPMSGTGSSLSLKSESSGNSAHSANSPNTMAAAVAAATTRTRPCSSSDNLRLESMISMYLPPGETDSNRMQAHYQNSSDHHMRI